jgi:threonine/homoserine/homoserine lactone efflux protein
MSGLAAEMQGILLAYEFFLLMIVSTGPNNLAVMGASMSSGRGAGIAIISLGLQADSSFRFVAAIVSGTTILAAGVHCIYAIAFSTAVAVRGYNKARRWIETGMGMFFTLAGIKLLGSEIQATSALQD